jgi:hypothetical protein
MSVSARLKRTSVLRLALVAALVAVLGAVAGVLVASGDGAGGAEPTSTPLGSPGGPAVDEILLWSFDGLPRNPEDEEYAVAVARRSAIVVGRERYGQYLDAMRDARPGIVVAPYRSAVAVAREELAWVRENHPDWLLKGTDGERIVNEWELHLVDPASPEVRAWRAEQAKETERQGWDAVYLDALGLYGLLDSSSRPVDPRTGEAFTADSWIEATAGLAKSIGDAVDIPVIGNGLRDGRNYYGHMPDGRFGGTRMLVPSIDGGVFETCFRWAKAPVDAFPPIEHWQEQLDALADMESRGKSGLCLTKVWTRASNAERQQWHDFALASLLLVSHSRSYFLFQARQGEPATTRWPGDDVDLGAPQDEMDQRDGAYVRRFENGLVVVNPSRSDIHVGLDGSYRTRDGDEAFSSVAVPAHTGLILLDA